MADSLAALRAAAGRNGGIHWAMVDRFAAFVRDTAVGP